MVEKETSSSREKTGTPDDTDAGDKKITQKFVANLKDFIGQYEPKLSNQQLDTLQNRYHIDLSKPLPELDSPSSKAYAAVDNMLPSKRIFAQVCQLGGVQRYRAIEQLQGIEHRAILELLAAGPVRFTNPDHERFVILYEYPKGIKLSQLVQENKIPTNSQYLFEHVLIPLTAAIQQFAELDLAHGCINPDNIYVAENAVLGPCVAEPCGYNQIFYCESVEREQALPAGKGEGSVFQDFYALAVTTLYIIHGPGHFSNFTPDSLIRAITREGAYNALMLQKEVPEIFYDFFRGTITLSPDDRWSLRHIRSWLEGKRFNVLTPPPPADASRPFDFGEDHANTRRELAHLYAHDWPHMISSMQNNQLAHWIAVSLRNKEMADAIGRLSRAVLDIHEKNEVQTNELLMNILILMDPHGPIRIKQLAMHIDGMDSMCAELHAKKAHNDLQLFSRFIEMNMVNYWIELQKKITEDYIPSNHISEVVLRMERMREYIRNTGYGFGLERILYDLNPSMPCMSPMLSECYATTMGDLLIRLDQLAPKKLGEDPIDSHISAFLASKLGITNEIRLNELSAAPQIANSRTVLALHVLSLAQQRFEDLRLPGLSHWLTLQLIPLIETIHSRTLRKKLLSLLLGLAQSGYLPNITDLIISTDYAIADSNGFDAATFTYHNNAKIIETIEKPEYIEYESVRMGYNISRMLAYLGFSISLLLIMKGGF